MMNNTSLLNVTAVHEGQPTYGHRESARLARHLRSKHDVIIEHPYAATTNHLWLVDCFQTIYVADCLSCAVDNIVGRGLVCPGLPEDEK